MAGLIAGAMAGGGEGLMRAGAQYGDYLSKSTLQSEAAEIMKERDARLSELRKGEMTFDQDLKRKPFIEAAAEVDQAKGGTVDADMMGTQRPRNAAEMREVEKGAYKKRGLINEAMAMEGQDITREEAGKGRDLQRELSRLADERIRSEGQLNREQQLQLHRERMAEIKSQAKNVGLSVQATEQGLAIVNASDKSITVLKDEDGNPIRAAKQEDSIAVVKAIGELAKSMETTNPEMAKRLGDLAIGVLSTKTGRDLSPQPTDADVAGLRQRSKNKAAVDFFESKFGKGSAAKYLESSAPAAPQPSPGASAPAAPAMPDVRSEPGSLAAKRQESVAAEQQKVTAARDADATATRDARTKFDSDLTAMTPQELYDAYDGRLDRLTPQQRAIYQRRIREAK